MELNRIFVLQAVERDTNAIRGSVIVWGRCVASQLQARQQKAGGLCSFIGRARPLAPQYTVR
jgi:hypothetical protein